jgi:hypothetical protein
MSSNAGDDLRVADLILLRGALVLVGFGTVWLMSCGILRHAPISSLIRRPPTFMQSALRKSQIEGSAHRRQTDVESCDRARAGRRWQ